MNKKTSFLKAAFSFFLAFHVLSPSQICSKEFTTLLPSKMVDAIIAQTSGDIAYAHIRRISLYNRLAASDAYYQAAEYVLRILKGYGIQKAWIEEYPADGKAYYYMFKSFEGWDGHFGELWLVEPFIERIADFEGMPACLLRFSQSADVRAELIYVGTGTRPEDYEGKDVRGKIVLASGGAGAVHQQAVFHRGALGVVSYQYPRPLDYPDVVERDGIFPYETKDGKRATFGFKISYRKGEELRKALEAGKKLVVEAKVKANLRPSKYHNVIAEIPGTDPKAGEFVMTAHLCHFDPGSNDNASGAASLMEIARTIQRLLSSGEIEPLRQTIRFIWVPEMSGSYAYAATHPDIIEKMNCGINLDMVGSYLNRNNSGFYFHMTPHSLPHFINDVVANFADFVGSTNVEEDYYSNYAFYKPIISSQGSRDAFRYKILPFMGGSDHKIYNDQLIHVPMVFFNVWPDPYYESNQDTPDKCDPTTLRRGSFVAVASAIFTARAKAEEAIELASEVYSRGLGRLSQDIKKAFDYLNKCSEGDILEAFKNADNVVRHAVIREKKALASVLDLDPANPALLRYVLDLQNGLNVQQKEASQDVASLYQTICQRRGLQPREFAMTEEELAAGKIIPARNKALKGPLASSFLIEKSGLSSLSAISSLFRDERLVYETFNFIDGKNSILDIRNAVSAEYEPVELTEVKQFVETLAKAGVVTLKKL